MTYNEDKYLSIKFTRFFMKIVGFWKYENRREEIILNFCLSYTVVAIIFAIAVESVDLFYCWGNFDAVTYNACATMPLVLVLVKLSVFMIRRDLVVNLINFSENKFWNVAYNDFGKQIMMECETKGVIFVFTFTFLVSGTVFNYLLAPIVENIGKNSTDRVLPFKLWVDLPLTETPFFEITFVIQALSTIHSGICFFCFDNLLCILTIHVVGQFKILQNRLQVLCRKYLQVENTKDINPTNDVKLQTEIYNEFKFCIDQHRTLINYIESLESVFTFILLCQMLVSSLLVCVSGFQILLRRSDGHLHKLARYRANLYITRLYIHLIPGEFMQCLRLNNASWNFVRRLIFLSHVLGCITQLLLFTWTCNEIIVESEKVGDAVYHSDWYIVPHRELGISLKRGMYILMARVKHPCFLSAGKFCPMSLKAFTGILSRAMSYFTLLRQISEKNEN